MFEAFHLSPTLIKLAATALALGAMALVFGGLLAMLRLGRKPGDRVSDRPELVHGPQELPYRPEPVKESPRRSPES